MLRLVAIDKSYGATRALRAVTMEAAPGDVLGLVGENGAGKSTLLKILSGAVEADAGRIELDGREVVLHGTHDAQALGIASVFQELTLLRDLSVEQNLFLAEAPLTRWGTVDRRRLRRQAAEVLAAHQLALVPSARVAALSLGQQQQLEIVRAVARRPRILLLDEATSALGATEVAWLRALVARLAAAGTIVLFISHRWDEIVGFCNRVAVLRNGECVGEAETAALDEPEAVRLMTGHAASEHAFPAKADAADEVALRATQLASPVLHGVSLALRRGEILGLGGLVGQGQGHLLEALFGAHRAIGTVEIGGRPLLPASPRQAMAAGLAYVPQERKTQGLLLSKSVGLNLTLAILPRLRAMLGLIDPRAEAAIFRGAIERQKIKTAGADEIVRHLSGGNQQKVLLERWLLARPVILLLNDVTRGVDIGTKQHIYEVIAGIAREGVGVIWYSTDARELVGVAHRVLVMLGGRVVAELAGEEMTAGRIVEAAVLGGGSR
ncbi:ribose import ATP-binding protein RbsA [Kaistia sp. 32K]|uniref:sugar ABC transporter ATP-binding protein n=1 Tax=Kaistia sp. 32K TaxID=2795690 RepID=UPI0019159375|nr:sugar ABC transporter ATP-binding protein [Kaistia sp. 32K]BCP52405.1 ribose import ATP-binding protein RbsA [Kaistia sp. 32K]